MQLTESLTLHLQSAHVSYAGDCRIAPANISAVHWSTVACTWQVGAWRSVSSRKRSKPKRKEAHAVDPPALFCERIVPLLCLLGLSITRVEREVAEIGWKHSAVAPRMHMTGESRVSQSVSRTYTRSNRNGKEECPLWIRPPSFAT